MHNKASLDDTFTTCSDKLMSFPVMLNKYVVLYVLCLIKKNIQFVDAMWNGLTDINTCTVKLTCANSANILPISLCFSRRIHRCWFPSSHPHVPPQTAPLGSLSSISPGHSHWPSFGKPQRSGSCSHNQPRRGSFVLRRGMIVLGLHSQGWDWGGEGKLSLQLS